MSKKNPKQILPRLDPDPPETGAEAWYYILNEPHSPLVAPPNALKVETYDAPRLLNPDDRSDDRVVYGFGGWEKPVTWNELEKYNMLPFDFDERILYDLWQLLGKDKESLMVYLTVFFGLLEGDKGANCLGLAIKLASRDWTLSRATTAVGALQ